MEQQERVYEINHVVVLWEKGETAFFHVEEVMYAEKFIIITHRISESDPIIRTTIPYERIVKIDTYMEPHMPLLAGEQETVQDEVGKAEGITYRSSGRPTSMKTIPSSSVMDRLHELGITIHEAQDED